MTESPGKTIGSKTQTMNKTLEVPGPGQYSPTSQDKTPPKYSMSIKYGGIEGEISRKRYVPGPGTYKHDEPNKSIPSMKFGSG
jgi:hypothetical protein